MATSLARIKSQIEQLQKQADKLKSGIVQRLRKEIAEHGLTANDLFGEGQSETSVASRRRKAATTKAQSKAAKFGDSAGNTWGGVGKRPQWLRDALDAGASLDSFRLGSESVPSSQGGKADQRTARAKKSRAKRASESKAAPAKRAAKKVAPAKRAKPKAGSAPKKTKLASRSKQAASGTAAAAEASSQS